MKTNRNLLRVSAFFLLAGVIGMSSACGREHRQGASDLNQSLSGSPAPGSNQSSANALNGGVTGLSTGSGSVVTPAPNGVTGNNAADNVSVSQSLADQIAAMDEVKSANVFVAGRTAYVAVTLHYGAGVTNAADPKTNNTTMADVSDQMKTRIASKVKSVKPEIDNVYVSANPDFVERMNAYAQDVKNGRPVSGFIKEFYNTVERMFPYQPPSSGK